MVEVQTGGWEKVVIDPKHPKFRGSITTEFGTSGLTLDFGCGNRKHFPKSVGIDCRDYPPVDILCDATSLIPLPDNSVDYCYSYHTLEHVPTYLYGGLFRETFRVCAPGSTIDWWFPYWTHRTAYDWSHVSYLNEYCFTARAFASRFETRRIEYTYEDEFVGSSEEEKVYAQKHLVNAVKEMRIIFTPRK